MSLREPRMNIPAAILFALVITMAAPIISFAQGRGNGRGAGKPDKCAKFINCHDARDGRVDGRGPGVQNNYPYPNNYPFPSTYPNNYPDPNNYPYPTRTRSRRIDRDGDGDIDRDDRIRDRRDRIRDLDGDGDVDRDDYRLRRQRSGDRTENRDRRVRRQNRINDTD